MTTSTKTVSFQGVNGETHNIDLGCTPKGEPRKRLSGATVLKALYDYTESGASPEEVLSMLLGTKSLSVTEDGPRNEAHDAAFAAFVNSLRKVAPCTFTRSELTKKAVSAVGSTLGWAGIDEITSGAEALSDDFTAWMYEVSASENGGDIFAKAVVKQKGQQQVTLLAK
jgi:hypothetical protein